MINNIDFITQIADCVKFSGNIENGFCWDALCKQRLKNPKSLEPYGYKVYSQNDEDGIIHEIFSRIGTANKKFIEFGVQDGLESNTHLLLFYGWKGLWIEGSPEYCKEINAKFKPVIKNGQLTVKNAFITKENINTLFSEAGFTGEIDLLSIDIDGNDLYVWDAINVVNPRVVITEYNGKFPPDLEWTQAYNPTHIWNGTDWHGASLKAFEKLGQKKGYRLVGTDLRGCNAFFVRNDLASDLFYEEATAEALYNPLRCDLRFVAKHPANYCLAKQKDNLGLLNYCDYELLSGFHSEETAGNKTHAWTSQNESVLRVLLPKGTRTIKIPYSIPSEVLKNYKDCSVTFESVSTREKQTYNYSDVEGGGIFEFVSSNIAPEDIPLTFKISAETWIPAEILHSEDTRTLGIDLHLSEIRWQ